MKALLARTFDSADGLKLEDVAAPGAPGPDEVLVQLRAASVNPLDLKLISGVMQSVFAIRLPYVLGTDIAGVVEQTGELVTRSSPGDRVVGRLLPTRGGGFCEKVLAPAHALRLIADDLNYEEAAAIPTAAGTAWLCLFDIGKVRAGQRVLIHAGGGGVGGFAIQLAKRAGAYVVTTASSANLQRVRELGADEAVDYVLDDLSRHTADIDLLLLRIA